MGWIRRKPADGSKPPCADRHNCVELNLIHHEVRNAMLELHKERRQMLRNSSDYSRGILKTYETLGNILVRVDLALNPSKDRGPVPEDAI